MNFSVVRAVTAIISTLCVAGSVFASAAIAADEPGASTGATLKFPVLGKNIVDLTHVLGPGMPDFHGGTDAFRYKRVFSVKKDGYANGRFCTAEHYGTHVDAPSHFFDGKASIDQIPASELILPCVVIDVRDEVKANPDYRLTIEKVKSFEKVVPISPHCAVFLLTGWSDRWSRAGEYRNLDKKGRMHFPGFDKDSAEYLVNTRHVSCLGIDTLSIDAGTSETFDGHHVALSQGLFMIENLDNLNSLPATGAWTIVAPLRIQNGTGSPARVFAITP